MATHHAFRRVATLRLLLVLGLALPAFADDERVVESYPVRDALVETASQRVADVVGEASVEAVGNELIVTGTQSQQDRVEALLRALDPRPRRYEVTLLTGVGQAEAQRLVEGEKFSRFSPRSQRSVRREVSVLVREGQPAVVETGEIVEVIDGAYRGRFGSGYHTREQARVHGYRISVEPLGDGVEVSLEYGGANAATGDPRDQEIASLETSLWVPLDTWQRLSGPPATRGRNYGTQRDAAHTVTLVRVEDAAVQLRKQRATPSEP